MDTRTSYLKTLTEFLLETFPQDKSQYKRMPDGEGIEKAMFLFDHNTSHAGKNAGALNALKEKMDHDGNPPEKEEIKKILAKQMINILLMAKNSDIELPEIFREVVTQASKSAHKYNIPFCVRSEHIAW